MDDLNLLLRYATRALIWLAPIEFVLGRALSRAGKQMPAGAAGAAVFDVISTAGNFLVMPAFLLAVVVLALAALLALRGAPAAALAPPREPGGAWTPFLALGLLVFLVLSVGVLFPGAPAPLLVLYNLASAGLVLGLAGRFVYAARAGWPVRVTIGLLGLAYAGYYVYALAAILLPGNDNPDQAPGVLAVELGEGASMAMAISLLWTAGLLGRPRGTRRVQRVGLALAGGAAALVLIGALFEQWLQGVASQF